MRATLSRSTPHGKISAIASKSVAHRLLICASFADKPSLIRCEQLNDDINATIDCLCALGASIRICKPYIEVTPISALNKKAILPCNESGSTLRFLLPVCASLNGEFTFEMRGRLSERPLAPLDAVLISHGAKIEKIESDKLCVSGSLSGNAYEIAGNVSSQFITGLLLALSISKAKSTVEITGNLESAPYVDITLDALMQFGVEITKKGSVFYIPAVSLSAPKELSVEGDWSNAAFPLALGIIGGGEISVIGLDLSSKQGDKKIIELLREFGGEIYQSGSSLTARHSALHGIKIDASQIPDLVPILATVASVAQGETLIYGASRLRLKESDRLMSITHVLSTLGADIRETEDGLIIKGKKELNGGSVDSFGDHRIAMSVAVASTVCSSPVILDGAEASNKSYPDFWRDIETLGIATLLEKD